MRRTLLAITLFASITAFNSASAAENISNQRPPSHNSDRYYDDRYKDDRYKDDRDRDERYNERSDYERRGDHRDDRRRRERFEETYERQERDMKRIYNDLRDERYNSRDYKELKRIFYNEQGELREIRYDAKREGYRIAQSQWETIRIR